MKRNLSVKVQARTWWRTLLITTPKSWRLLISLWRSVLVINRYKSRVSLSIHRKK